MRKNRTNKVAAMLLALCMIVSMLTGCLGDKPAETTPEATTPVITPAATTPEATTPVVTPAATTPEATSPMVTPAATTSDATTPTETPAASTPESTPESTPVETPAEPKEYNITYDLDGGRAPEGNPDKYWSNGSDITLLAPIKAGYAFAGWTGTDLDAATEKVVIKSGSTGDRVYTATWRECDRSAASNDPNADKIEGLLGSDKNTPKNPNELPLSTTDLRGYAGEGMFCVRTAYTDIAIDGVMDAAYTYGLRFEMDMVQVPSLYENCDTGYDVYMIRGEDGKMHVFVQVIDHDIVINDAQWSFRWWHCDTWQMYIDFGNDRSANDVLWTFAAEPTKKYLQSNPENWIVVMTEDGFNIEFEFDNEGEPFGYGDEFSFGFFYNDSSNYKESRDGGYDRSNTGTKSVLDPKFHLSNVSVQDAVRITTYPLTYDGNLNGSGNSGGASTGNMLADIGSGAASVAIVTGKQTHAYNEINAEELVQALLKIGVRATLVREDRLSDPGKFDYIIYSNTAADKGAAEAFATLDYNQYGAIIGENAIYTFGWTWDGNDGMCDVILGLLAQAAGGDPELLGSRYVYSLPNVRGENVPKVDGTYCIIDSGEDAYIIVKQNAVIDDYNAYVAKLTAAGYTLYDSNKMASVTTATYYKEGTVINMLYSSAEGDKTMRVVVETMEKTALAPLEAETIEDPGVSSITQVDLGGGLCHIIKLANGEFIIVDSGNQGKQEKIYQALLSLHKSNRPIIVAAWIFTHFHQDHIGGFCDFVDNDNYLRKVQIKSIIYNPPERFFLDISKQNSAGDRANIIRWKGHLEKLQANGAVVYQARTGQKYAIGNAMIEILGTFDDLVPFYMRADSSNHTSVVFSLTVNGNKIMFLGDATSPELLFAAKRYGDYLRSDIVQLSHHGYGDGGSDSAFYKAVNAPTVLHPGTSISGGAERWAANNAEKVYSYGSGNITLPLTLSE